MSERLTQPIARRTLLTTGAVLATLPLTGLKPRVVKASTEYDLLAQKPRQEFFWQTGENGRGFFVAEDFLDFYKRLGGPAFLGYPLSSHFTDGEKQFQLFQKGMLYRENKTGSVRLFPLLDSLHQLGFDQELEKILQIPPLGKTQSADSAVKVVYEEKGGEEVFGKAYSELVNYGTFSVQRFAAVAFQLWNTSVPGMLDKGSVVLVNIGQFAKDKGILPKEALLTEYAKTKTPLDNVVWRGRENLPYVYLTIDDFWDSALLEPILDIAKREKIKLTFFPVGSVMGKRPDLWQRAVKEGHAIENHTQTHRWLSKLSDEQIRWEIQTQQETVRKVLGDPNYQQRFLRPPAGAGIFDYDHRIPQIAQELGYEIAMWTADSNGYQRYGAGSQPWAVQATVSDIEKNLYHGSIVLQHALYPDIPALEIVIEEIKQRGLFPITIPEGFD